MKRFLSKVQPTSPHSHIPEIEQMHNTGSHGMMLHKLRLRNIVEKNGNATTGTSKIFRVIVTHSDQVFLWDERKMASLYWIIITTNPIQPKTNITLYSMSTSQLSFINNSYCRNPLSIVSSAVSAIAFRSKYLGTAS